MSYFQQEIMGCTEGEKKQHSREQPSEPDTDSAQALELSDGEVQGAVIHSQQAHLVQLVSDSKHLRKN